LALVCGCASTPRTLTKAGLEAKATKHADTSSPDRVYYVGSDNRYDFFVVRSGAGKPSQLYRVSALEKAVADKFLVTKDEAEWRDYQVPTPD
jgi:hypothetical protein